VHDSYLFHYNTSNGAAGDLMMIGPPFSIEDDQIDEMILVFKRAILQVSSSVLARNKTCV